MANEKKLIYADDVRREILATDPKLAYIIDRIKPVDAVPVTRCKDCKQWLRNNGIAESPNGHCFNHDIDTNGHDFCSYGVRGDEHGQQT